MAHLGTPYRVIYESKDLRPGLTDVKAFIVKPDSSVAGVFTFAEMPFQSMAGIYAFDLMTSLDDVEGEWVGMIHSPSEGNKSPFRVSFQRNPANEIRAIIANFLANGIKEDLNGRFTSFNEYTHFMETGPELTGYVLPEEAEGDLNSNEISGETSAGIIEGEIDHGL